VRGDTPHSILCSPVSDIVLLTRDSPVLDPADPQESNDFERFKIQLAKRSRRDVVRKAYVKEKKASA